MPRDANSLTAPRTREPVLNAPWSVLVLIVVLIGAHATRLLAGLSPQTFALTQESLRAHRGFGLITYVFVHASWAHVLMNAVFTLAFGAPVARFLGVGARGALAFFAFFVVCGVVAALGYAGLLEALSQMGAASQNGWALVGASGAASGLLGAAARLMNGRGRLGSMFGRNVAAMTLAWVAANALLGLLGLTPGAAGMPVAWEAHIIGFFAGLLMIGPFARIAGARRYHSIAP
jgi:membrane associated rhomboid family serine protease